MVRILNANAEL
jgi:hypothetical protein